MAAQEIVDVLVLGAGPAGGAVAYHLARRGHGVLVVDKAPSPRVKPCGGGLSPQVREWFDFSFEPVLSARVRRVRFTFRGADPVESELGTQEPLWMVRRADFDRYLMAQAQEQGAAFRPGTEVLGLCREGERWVARVPEGEIRARYVVGADGALGLSAKWLGFSRRARRVAGGLEGEAAATPSERVVHFDFGSVAGGYQWNFPKADGWSIGSGVFLGRDRDLRGHLRDYAGSFGVDLEACRPQGHPLLLWDGDQELHAEGALLAGEAACLVDPFTAEGIRPALRSGVLAAEALHRALSGEARDLSAYSAAVQLELGREFAWARRLARVFYRFPALGYRLAMKHPRGPQRMAQIIAGERSYADTARGLLAKFGLSV